jgi:hypothetical protein
MPDYNNEPRNYKNEFPNSGTMNAMRKTKPSDKDLWGKVSLSGEVLTYILNEMNHGASEVVLEVSAWKKIGNGKNPFLSLSIRTPFKEREQQQVADVLADFGDPQPQQRYEQRQPPPMQANPSHNAYADRGQPVRQPLPQRQEQQPAPEFLDDEIPF